MDKTIRQYLTEADATQDFVEKFWTCMDKEQFESKITELQSKIKTLQVVAYHMASISNYITRFAHKKITKEIAHIDPYPTSNDVCALKFNNNEEKKEIIADVTIPVKEVDRITDIPVSKLYYIKELKQYAINVEGIIIKGELANITNYKSENSAKCEYGIECKSFTKNQECKYYHDPEDFIHWKKPIPNRCRNFTVGSWIYDSNHKAYYTRHIGGKNTLDKDLMFIKKIQYKDEISNREGQLIHDLLIYMILNSKGLISKYQNWISK